MSVATTIFLFLLVGSQFTYVYHFHMTNGLITFNGNIVWNLTWVGDRFNASGVVNFTSINATGVSHYTYNITETQPQYSRDWYTLATIFFPYFIVNSYSLGYYNGSLPSITLVMDNNSYIIISAQYGLPLAGKWVGNRGGFNTTYDFTMVKSSLPLTGTHYDVYRVNVTNSIAFTALSPDLVEASEASYSVKVLNSTVNLPGLTLVGKGFLTLIIPSQEINQLGGIAVMFYNGSKYFVGLTPSSVQYMNSSNPFLVTILGNYIFMFFPYGGNVTFIFYNPNLHESISVIKLTQGSENVIRYVVLGAIIVAVLGFGTALALRARRPS